MTDKETITVRVSHGDGKVISEIDWNGTISREVIDVLAVQRDKAIRAELIKLGWTPPP